MTVPTSHVTSNSPIGPAAPAFDVATGWSSREQPLPIGTGLLLRHAAGGRAGPPIVPFADRGGEAPCSISGCFPSQYKRRGSLAEVFSGKCDVGPTNCVIPGMSHCFLARSWRASPPRRSNGGGYVRPPAAGGHGSGSPPTSLRSGDPETSRHCRQGVLRRPHTGPPLGAIASTRPHSRRKTCSISEPCPSGSRRAGGPRPRRRAAPPGSVVRTRARRPGRMPPTRSSPRAPPWCRRTARR